VGRAPAGPIDAGLRAAGKGSLAQPHQIQVMGREEIVPTYRIPPLVRAVSGSVDPTGIEPVTSAMPWRHSTK
jgi:hypothetical protein